MFSFFFFTFCVSIFFIVYDETLCRIDSDEIIVVYSVKQLCLKRNELLSIHLKHHE